MAIAPIVTRGYGAFGGINLLPTRGYAIGVAPVIEPVRILNVAWAVNTMLNVEYDRTTTQALAWELDTTKALTWG